MESAHQSFFHDANSDEPAQSLVDELAEMPESRGEEHHVPTELSGSNNMAGPSNSVVEPTATLERSDPPQALVVFVLGGHRFSDSCELGVMNEHPEALQAITSNQCLSTSAFLKPALNAAMAELRPSMMVQVAVRLTSITLRLAAKILQTQNAMAQGTDVCGSELQGLSETIRCELEQAVPYYQWQGSRNYYGQVQYLMALLQEAIGAFAVPTSSLAEALKEDVQARRLWNMGGRASAVVVGELEFQDTMRPQRRRRGGWHIPGFRKRRTMQSEEGNTTAEISLAKRRKVVEDGSCS